jgi:hypothetical protein
VDTWGEFDPNATCFIHINQLHDFMMKLKVPLGFGDLEEYLETKDEVLYAKFLRCVNIRDHDGRIYFPELLWTCMFSLCGCANSKVDKHQIMKDNLKQLLLQY